MPGVAGGNTLTAAIPMCFNAATLTPPLNQCSPMKTEQKQAPTGPTRCVSSHCKKYLGAH
jgi:hypothetical protein